MKKPHKIYLKLSTNLVFEKTLVKSSALIGANSEVFLLQARDKEMVDRDIHSKKTVSG